MIAGAGSGKTNTLAHRVAHLIVNGADLTSVIRTPEITAASAAIANSPVVRRGLVEWQRRLAQGRSIVCEGRDQGTIVFPDAGCKFSYYHPVASWRIDLTNRRSHRRMLVVDGKIGFTGGAAFQDKWTGHAQDEHHWRDTHLRLEGPIVSDLQSAFQGHWVKTYKEALTGAGQFPQLPRAGDLKARIVESHSFSIAPIPLVQAVTFAAAEKRIWITNPYCTPTDDQVLLLTQAAQRGVDVRLLLPGPHNDQPLTQSAGRTAYGKLLEGGVKIFEYQPTMIHAKTMVADGIFASVTSIDPKAASLRATPFASPSRPAWCSTTRTAASSTRAPYNLQPHSRSTPLS